MEAENHLIALKLLVIAGSESGLRHEEVSVTSLNRMNSEPDNTQPTEFRHEKAS